MLLSGAENICLSEVPSLNNVRNEGTTLENCILRVVDQGLEADDMNWLINVLTNK